MASLKNFIIIFSSFLLVFPLHSVEFDRASYKQQILYAAQTTDHRQALSLYKEYQKNLGRYYLKFKKKIGTLWIEQSARSKSPEKQTLGLFAYGLANLQAPFDLLEHKITSPDMHVQRATLSLLGRMQEDHADLLLNKAMASQFLYARLEAAYLLALKKAPSATGQIESLMHRLPPQMRYFFPEFFAIIGSSEAIQALRHLMDDAFYPTKIEAILSAARHGRDDLLPPIRAAATHLNNAEQEACAAALGYLKDTKSIKKLQKLANHPSIQVQLAALLSLFHMGDERAVPKIAKEASDGNIFAITILGEIPGQEESLLPLLQSKNQQIRFNAAVSLLQQKDPRSLPYLLEFLIKDCKDLGFQQVTSLGGSLRAWTVVPSLSQHAENNFFDIQAFTLSLKEELLLRAIELPEKDFLDLARILLRSKQNELIPTLVFALENLRTEGAITLLKEQSNQAGAPFIRTYCNLALCRLQQKGSYKKAVKDFLRQNKSKELIRFRPDVPWDMKPTNLYQLNPEERSALLIKAYETLAEQQDVETIDVLLEALEEGHVDNCPVLA